MGEEGLSVVGGLTAIRVPPEHNVMEVTVIGPGYGECILLHIGKGSWIIVDSCLNSEARPAALKYFQDLGLNPAEVVRLIVATHWHDDHIRGMGRLVEVCNNATFCCASVFCKKEFLTAVGAMANRPMSTGGSGMREFYKVLSLLEERSSMPVFAIANRIIFSQDGCEVWALSPFDKEFDAFLWEIGLLLPQEHETKRRIPTLTPNKVAVALLIKIDNTAILLGSDLEGQGWLEIFNAPESPSCKASFFKIPHHGSQNAHEDRVWNEMLHSDPIAALTPWQRGGLELPKERDVQRICSFTEKAYATASRNDLISEPIRDRSNPVERTIRETGVKIKRTRLSPGMIRLRREFGSQTDWNIETLGSACQLADY